jgi:3,4-dihydroxy 2-butanone 4-phosphate synthase/GTP cyclohydrolase II
MNAILNDQKSLQALKRVNQAIQDIKQGKMVVMVDDEDRENEGDLVYAAQLSTPEKVNFMASHAKGLICVSVSREIAKNLELVPMVKENDSSYETAFTVSVDAKNAATGISAFERDMTIKILADAHSKPTELVRPGHIFPLIAKEGGVLARIGHTEGSVDLCALAGLRESAVICEIMKEDGSMARRPDLDLFCAKHGLNIVYISDLVEYRMMHESLIRRVCESRVEFMGAPARKVDFLDHFDNQHTVYAFGKPKERAAVKFHTIMPDSVLLASEEKRTALLRSIAYVQKYGGIVVFMESGTEHMRHMREYGIGAQIVKKMGITKIELLSTSEARAFVGIGGFGLEVVKHLGLSKSPLS